MKPQAFKTKGDPFEEWAHGTVLRLVFCGKLRALVSRTAEGVDGRGERRYRALDAGTQVPRWRSGSIPLTMASWISLPAHWGSA